MAHAVDAPTPKLTAPVPLPPAAAGAYFWPKVPAVGEVTASAAWPIFAAAAAAATSAAAL